MARTTGLCACLILFACGGGSPKPAAAPTPVAEVAEKPDEPVKPVKPEAAAPRPAAPPATKSLYARLGELPAIKAVVEEFVARTTTDPRIKERFFNTDADNLKRL